MKTNKNDIIIAIFIILFVSAFLIGLTFIPIKTTTQNKCTYDRSIELQKARFDLVNAYYNYPYDKLKVDFAYALQYARCN